MSLKYKSKFLTLADLALCVDYLFRIIDACKFRLIPSAVNASCMLCIALLALIAYLFTLPFFARQFYFLLGICVIADLVVMGLIHPHAFTAPYIFAHCCIGCFYLATPRCLIGERPKGKQHKKH